MLKEARLSHACSTETTGEERPENGRPSQLYAIVSRDGSREKNGQRKHSFNHPSRHAGAQQKNQGVRGEDAPGNLLSSMGMPAKTHLQEHPVN